jgi:hypothetical protein
MNVCLFLTASIDPKNTPQVGRNSIYLRESDYLYALTQFSTLNLKIVFCENSGYHSEKIINFCSEKGIEYISFISKDSFKGKWHGEKEIFDYAFSNSKYILNSDYIVKVTGRLFIKNLSSILKDISNRNFYVSTNLSRNLSWSDSRLIIFNKQFYQDYFKPALELYLDESKGVYFERCLSWACHKVMADGLVWLTLPSYPNYFGHNASNNQKYQKNFFKRIKYNIYYKIKRYVMSQTI